MIDFLSYSIDELSSWRAILAAFIAWSLFYFSLRNVLQEKSPEYISRIVAGTHGLVMAYFGCNECFGDWKFSRSEQVTTSLQTLILLASLGYFIEDTVWCFYYQTESPLMLAHHCFSCFAIYRLLIMRKSGGQSTCALGVLELSNPCLQTRWFVRYHGYQKTTTFYVIEFIFIVSFLILRVFLGTHYLVYIIAQPNTFEFRALATTIYIISWMFVINIVKYVQYKYLTVQPQPNNGIQTTFT
ncbi:transmembrane protein 136-like [Agrilus planipennis]|uniref:Transmembrane protein 136-like n=1 Tax=Agrilus planipennis TaxID=224129 RepID=A0A1W4WD57_AGRPL|nr:transmembrane protein 136-like [Agrilus planipennis]XP_025836963.1 transmembrane protein 136-like [Agrilus planipennis]XP_025836964.1 transmembrane protein 136-like [Agrilus planipennis]